MSLITPEAPRRFYRRWMDCLVPVILGCLISDEALGAQRMRLGTLVPKGSSYYNHLKTMESAWKRSPGGGVSISIYPDDFPEMIIQVLSFLSVIESVSGGY